MAQFDYYRMADGDGFWVDCQTSLMDDYDSRFVVPLVPTSDAPLPAAAHLNPRIEIAGAAYSLLTQFAGSIPQSELGERAGSLERERYAILNAIDFMLSGV